jgi:hypothetical protein
MSKQRYLFSFVKPGNPDLHEASLHAPDARTARNLVCNRHGNRIVFASADGRLPWPHSELCTKGYAAAARAARRPAGTTPNIWDDIQTTSLVPNA